METTRYRRWRAVAGLHFVALPIFGLAAAPPGLADDFDCIASVSLDCMMNSDGGFGDSGGFGGSGGFQAGDLVLPAGGGPPQVAVAPAPIGGPVITAGGGVVVPAAPPIG